MIDYYTFFSIFRQEKRTNYSSSYLSNLKAFSRIKVNNATKLITTAIIPLSDVTGFLTSLSTSTGVGVGEAALPFDVLVNVIMFSLLIVPDVVTDSVPFENVL